MKELKGRGVWSLILAAVLIYFILPNWIERHLMTLGVFFHEAGHALACLFTGGRVDGFVLPKSGGGYALVAGGWPILVYSGGYIGTAVSGSLLLYLNAFGRLRRFILGGTGVFILGLTFWYGSGVFTWVFGLIAGAAFLAMGLRLGVELQYHCVNFLGVLIGLRTLQGFKRTILITLGMAKVCQPEGITHKKIDCQMLADATWIPAVVWAFFWLSATAVLYWLAAKRAAKAR